MNPKWKSAKSKRRGRPRKLRRRRRLRQFKNGILSIRRKTAPCYLVPTAIAGIPQTINGTGMNSAWLTLGTPVGLNGTNYDIPFTMEFRLSDITGYTDITNLCDQYKINSVKVNIYYNSTTADVNGPASMPSIFYISDHDDSGVVSRDQIRQRMGLKYKQFTSNKPRVSMGVRPRVAPIIYDGATSAYSIPIRATWLNTAYSDAPHYSIRGYFSNVYLPSNVDKAQVSLFTFDITYSVTGKDFD